MFPTVYRLSFEKITHFQANILELAFFDISTVFYIFPQHFVPQFTGFPSDDDDQESKSHGLPLSMAARYVIDSKRSVTRFIRAISRRLFPEFFGPNATGIPRQYNVSGRHGKQKLDPVRYNIIIRITNRFWANTVDFPYSNVPEPIIRRAVDGLLRCKDNRRSLPMHLQEAWDKLYPHDT